MIKGDEATGRKGENENWMKGIRKAWRIKEKRLGEKGRIKLGKEGIFESERREVSILKQREIF